MKNFTGFLIRQQRIQKGLSQEALCRGICAVSYLSKIEQGIGNPSPVILQQLFDVLGIRFNQNEQQLLRSQEMLDSYFDKFFHSETAEDEETYLKLHQTELENSQLHLSWHLFYLFSLIQKYGKASASCLKEADYLGRFTDNMEPEQLFRYHVGAGMLETAEQLEHLAAAEALRPTSFVKQTIAETLYTRKDYMKAIEAADRAFSAAAEEGSIPTMLWSSFLLGACYSGFRDLSFTIRYYSRALELARGYDPSISGLIRSNLGTAYLTHQNYNDAITQLSLSLKTARTTMDDQRILTAQKLATAYFESGRLSQGHQTLQQAAAFYTDKTPSLYGRLLQFTELRYEKQDRSSAEYEELLTLLYASAEEKLGEGYRVLLGSQLTELYMSQRKYKEALALTHEYSLF